MRRILDIVVSDEELILQIENIMMPCIEHSLTEAGMDRVEESLDCIIQFVYHGYKYKPISN